MQCWSVHVCVWLGAAVPGNEESGVDGIAVGVYGEYVDMPRLLRKGCTVILG